MGAHLITGYAGKEHITAADQGGYNAGTLGPGKYVLPLGNMFAYEVISNNLIKIRDGELVNQGRHINIPVNDYEECEIDNGIQSLKRNDLIVIRYEKNADTGIESANMIVIKGISGETAVDPNYTTGNIFKSDSVDDFPLYRIKLTGLNITAVEPLFNTIISFKSLLDLVGNTSIKGIGNGTITSAIAAQNTILGKKVNDETFDSHKNSSDHDGRYYTESEINTLLNGKAPASHASTGTVYGVGTTDRWGHIRIVNGFTHAQYYDGYALSGYAGYLLKKEIDAITESPTWKNTNTSGKSTDVMYSRKAGIGFVLCTSAPHNQVAANTWVTLGNIPDGYRPTQNTPFVGAYGSLPIIGYVYTNGNIVIYSTTAIPTTGNAICFNVSYPLA